MGQLIIITGHIESETVYDNLISNGLHSDKIRLRAPQVNKDQMYILTLTVTDNGGLSDKDSMKLLVKDTINTNSVAKKTTTKTVTTTQKGEILKYYYIGKIGFPGTGKGTGTGAH